MSQQPQSKSETERAKRLAEALRDNLRRRKAPAVVKPTPEPPAED